MFRCDFSHAEQHGGVFTQRAQSIFVQTILAPQGGAPYVSDCRQAGLLLCDLCVKSWLSEAFVKCCYILGTAHPKIHF
jgi:hypothetical protein